MGDWRLARAPRAPRWLSGSRWHLACWQIAAVGFPLLKSTKNLVARESAQSDSKRVEDLPKDMLLRVMDRQTVDGVEKALISRDGSIAKPIGYMRSDGAGACPDGAGWTWTGSLMCVGCPRLPGGCR